MWLFQFSKGFQVFQFSKDHLQLQLFQLCHPFHLNWSMFVNKLSLYLYLYVFKHCFLLYLAAKLIGTIAKKLLPQILSVLPRVVGSTSAPPQGDPENHITLVFWRKKFYFLNFIFITYSPFPSSKEPSSFFGVLGT